MLYSGNFVTRTLLIPGLGLDRIKIQRKSSDALLAQSAQVKASFSHLCDALLDTFALCARK